MVDGKKTETLFFKGDIMNVEKEGCMSCGRKNSFSWYPGDFGMIAVCRWCKAEFKTWEEKKHAL